VQLKKIAAIVFGTALFAACSLYLYAHFDWASSMSIFLAADLRWLVGGGTVCYLAYISVRALRWQIMIRAKGSTSRFVVAYFVIAITQGLAMVTPGQLGEVLKVELTKRHGDLGRLMGAGAFMTERLIDMIILGAAAIVGLAVYGPVMRAHEWIAAVTAVSVAGLCVVGLVLFSRTSARATGLRAKLAEASPLPSMLVKVSLISLVSWMFVALAWLMALRSIGIGLDIMQCFWLLAVIAITQFASLIPGGVGAADLATVELLKLWGNDPNQALAGAIALRVLGLLMVGIALLHWAGWSLLKSKLISRALEQTPVA
jgi:uncharacterized membrane protein YbhN (UPF0104 family)